MFLEFLKIVEGVTELVISVFGIFIGIIGGPLINVFLRV